MADACGSCGKPCKNNYAIQCTKCVKWFHTKCIGMQTSLLNYYANELKTANGERYKCDTCTKNSEVKGKSETSNGEFTGKNKQNSKDTTSKDSTNYTINDVMLKLNEMDQRYSDLLNKYEEQVRINDDLKKEITNIKRQLNKEVSYKEQNSIRNNVIVKGIPQSIIKPEDIVQRLKNSLECSTLKTKCYKLGKSTDRPTPIKVCFENEMDKERFMLANKTKRLTTKSIGLEGEEKKIYLDHDLSVTNQYIYKEARMFRKENDYKYLWIKGGKIYLRKEDDSKVKLIEDVQDLKN